MSSGVQLMDDRSKIRQRVCKQNRSTRVPRQVKQVVKASHWPTWQHARFDWSASVVASRWHLFLWFGPHRVSSSINFLPRVTLRSRDRLQSNTLGFFYALRASLVVYYQESFFTHFRAQRVGLSVLGNCHSNFLFL